MDKNKRFIVSGAQCPQYESNLLEDALDRVLLPFGGMKAIIKPGQRVLIKPNLILHAPNEPSPITHPELVAAVARCVRRLGADVFVSDSPAFGTARGVAMASGYEASIEKGEFTIVEFAANDDVRRKQPSLFGDYSCTDKRRRKRIQQLSTITRSIKEYDVIINIPKLKAHCQMVFTGAVKNLYGCIQGKAKAFRHFSVGKDRRLFTLALLEMYDRIQPELTIIDAIDVMEQTGPRHGPLVRRGLLLAGVNALAVDVAIAKLLKKPYTDFPLLDIASQYDFPQLRENAIDIVGDIHDSLATFVLPDSLLPISFSSKTVITSLIRHISTLFKEKKEDANYL